MTVLGQCDKLPQLIYEYTETHFFDRCHILASTGPINVI